MSKLSRALIAFTCLAAFPTAAATQRLGGGGGEVGVSWLRVLLALVVCLLLAFLAALLLRQRNGGSLSRLLQIAASPDATLRVLERRPLGFRQEVVRLAYKDRVFLLVVGQHRALLIHDEQMDGDDLR